MQKPEKEEGNVEYKRLISSNLNRLEAEKEEGNVEYKRLISSNLNRLEALASQMKWRLTEGIGECYYYIGVEDNGTLSKLSRLSLLRSLINLKKVVDIIQSKIARIEKIEVGMNEYLIVKIKKEFNSNYLFLF